MARPDVTWRRSADLALVESTDRVVALHLAHLDRPARILEGSTAAIWHAVVGVRTTSEIVNTVAEQYGVAPDEIVEDVIQLLRDLGADALLIRGRQP